MWRVVGMLIVVAALFTGLIWWASAYESGRLGRPKSKADQGLIVKLKPEERPEYVLVCNETKFRDAFERFGTYVKVSLDPLMAPGGPAVLTLGDIEVPPELQRHQRVTVEFLKRHSPKRVVLMAHEECLIDDSIGAWLNDPGRVRLRQIAQLGKARSVIQVWLPTTAVELYYGENYGQHEMRFFRISESQLMEAQRLLADDSVSVVRPG